MARLELVRNDYGYALTFTIKDAQDNVVDLTNSTVKFKVKAYGASSLLIDANCTITDAVNGVVTYTVQQTDFTITKRYKGELQVTWTGGRVMTASDLAIDIVEDLG
jgi:hypothetical protein